MVRKGIVAVAAVAAGLVLVGGSHHPPSIGAAARAQLAQDRLVLFESFMHGG